MKKTILLVEDDYLDVESVRRALKKLNVEFDLHIAHNGADAITMLTTNRTDKPKLVPDIIILDINMPKMNGMEFLGIIKNYFSLKQIKIFVLTTSAEEYDKMYTENLGVNGYIIKPLAFNDSTSMSTMALLKELLSEDE